MQKQILTLKKKKTHKQILSFAQTHNITLRSWNQIKTGPSDPPGEQNAQQGKLY